MSSKKSKKSSQKSQLTDTTNDSQTIEEPIPEPQPEKPPDIRTISITISSFRNILPLYPTSDIKVDLKYLNRDLGETKPIPVTDEENLPISESFEINIDVDSVQQIDQLASNPVFITAIQSSGAFDEGLYEQLQVSKDVQEQPEQVESLFSLYEAFTGDKPAVQITEGKKKKKGVLNRFICLYFSENVLQKNQRSPLEASHVQNQRPVKSPNNPSPLRVPLNQEVKTYLTQLSQKSMECA